MLGCTPTASQFTTCYRVHRARYRQPQLDMFAQRHHFRGMSSASRHLAHHTCSTKRLEIVGKLLATGERVRAACEDVHTCRSQ